jgi:hypothetical protein
MNAGMPLAPVNLIDANLLTFLAFPQFDINSWRVNEILWDMSSSTETKAAWNCDSLRYLRWKGTVGLILVEAMASRSLVLTGSQPAADCV